MKNKTIANLIFFIHIIVTILNLVFPLILQERYLFIGFGFTMLIIIQWLLLNGGCILTILRSYFNNTKTSKTLKDQFVDRLFNRIFGLNFSEKQLKYINMSILIYIFSTYAYRYKKNILLTIAVAALTGIIYYFSGA